MPEQLGTTEVLPEGRGGTEKARAAPATKGPRRCWRRRRGDDDLSDQRETASSQWVPGVSLILPEKGIERRRAHRSWRRSAAISAEKGDSPNSPHPEDDKPKGRRVKLHRATREQEEQETERGSHCGTAFTVSSRGGNGGNSARGELELQHARRVIGKAAGR